MTVEDNCVLGTKKTRILILGIWKTLKIIKRDTNITKINTNND